MIPLDDDARIEWDEGRGEFVMTETYNLLALLSAALYRQCFVKTGWSAIRTVEWAEDVGHRYQ